MPSYSYRPGRPNPLTSTLTSGVQADEPPAKQSQKDLQVVLDDAHEQGILEEPAKAAEVREQGVIGARIDIDDGEPVLVETVEPKARKLRKTKAQK